MCIRGSYTAPTTGFWLFRVFRVFRGSTPVFRGSFRGSYSPTFILFSCISCFSWLPLPLTFAPIRAHSWFILSSTSLFSCLSCISWFHSCPFVVHTLPPLPSFFVYFVFFVVAPAFEIRVHSYPFVVHTLSPAFFFRAFRVFRGSTPVFRGSIRGSELWRRGLSSLPAAGFASSLSGYINRVWTETGGRSDYFGEESPDTTGQEARLKDRVSREKPAVRIAQQRRDRRPFCVGKGEKGGVRAHRGSSQGLSARQAPSGARPNRKRGAARAMRKHSFGYRSR